MRRPHGDVGPQELLDDIDQPVVTDQPLHKGVAHQHFVAESLRADIRMALGQPMHVLGCFARQIGVDGVPDDDVAFFVVFLL